MRNKLMALAPATLRGLAVILFLNGGGAWAEEVGLTHVHGLAWSADGARLYIPSHHGLAVYQEGRWSKAPGPEHDYMGFSATRERFYSSGHPAAGSGLVNPFGLIRSDDGGKTWKKLGLEGESDFHLLATGFASNAVYVFNHGANSRMKSAGLHYTLNDGLMWKPATGRGLSGEPLSLAVHPEDPKVVAVGTRDGLFLSVDSGENFRRAATGQTLAVSFDLDGTHLWSAGHDGAPTLHRMDWKGGEASAVTLPPLADDAVAYIAQNPARRDEYAIATFKRSAFVSREGGRAWEPIARQGQGVDRRDGPQASKP
ncbi:MAG: glycosyl hydrolase [Rhodocyclaceae bacterium]|nr:glycosyl hydrolase [Rhodocyclaceae bacterium]